MASHPNRAIHWKSPLIVRSHHLVYVFGKLNGRDVGLAAQCRDLFAERRRVGAVRARAGLPGVGKLDVCLRQAGGDHRVPGAGPGGVLIVGGQDSLQVLTGLQKIAGAIGLLGGGPEEGR